MGSTFSRIIVPLKIAFVQGLVKIQMPLVSEWAALFHELLLPANDVFCRGWCQYKAMSSGAQEHSCISIWTNSTTDGAFGGCILMIGQKLQANSSTEL